MAVDLVREVDDAVVEVSFVVSAVPPAEIRRARSLVEQLAESQREAAIVSRNVAAALTPV
ncbi:hypothetical protein ACOBQX_18670 [Actinokineospora sp. G85]|uniref:hypothetical protein n=1 Tax=Actinokineospora sp. G85 TaxID=3406626 RepID=UPI003C726FC6